jgi:hypothetical protein
MARERKNGSEIGNLLFERFKADLCFALILGRLRKWRANFEHFVYLPENEMDL